jgi:hypothetical protein
LNHSKMKLGAAGRICAAFSIALISAGLAFASGGGPAGGGAAGGGGAGGGGAGGGSAGGGGGAGGGGAGGGGAGGGGGAAGAPLLRLDGDWAGQIVIPAPVVFQNFTLTLTEDSAGNLQGTICLQIPAGCGPIISGRVAADGTFAMRFENLDLTGSLIGLKICPDGSTSNWIAGGVQYRGAFGTWALTQCPA